MNKEGWTFISSTLVLALLISIGISQFDPISGEGESEESVLFEGFITQQNDYHYLATSYGDPLDTALLSREKHDLEIGDQVSVSHEQDNEGEPPISEDDVGFDSYAVSSTNIYEGLDPETVRKAIEEESGANHHISEIRNLDGQWIFDFSDYDMGS